MPRRILRAHLLPTLLFTLFSILNGLAQTGIDNAAHFGGLAAGLLLGWAFAIPLSRQIRSAWNAPARRAGSSGHSWRGGIDVSDNRRFIPAFPAKKFLIANDWYRLGEAKNTQRWQEIANRAAAGDIASSDLARLFQTEIIPFWREAEPRLRRRIVRQCASGSRLCCGAGRFRRREAALGARHHAIRPGRTIPKRLWR